MGDVKRYHHIWKRSITHANIWSEMYVCEDGEYVLHSDYAALLTRHNALVGAVREIKKYARHRPECYESSCPLCVCGFSAALVEVDRLIATADCKDPS